MSTIIPAQSGYFIIEVPPDDQIDDVALVDWFLSPVLAWRMNEHGYLDPITVESLVGEGFIQCPHGRVIEPEIQEWRTVEAFEEDMRSRAAKRLAKKASAGK